MASRLLEQCGCCRLCMHSMSISPRQGLGANATQNRYTRSLLAREIFRAVTPPQILLIFLLFIYLYYIDIPEKEENSQHKT